MIVLAIVIVATITTSYTSTHDHILAVYSSMFMDMMFDVYIHTLDPR